MRIVICDDSQEQRDKGIQYIKEAAQELGYEIDIAAYSSAKSFLFDMEDTAEYTDLCILDINMPDIKGIDAAIKLREDGYTGEIVFLTVSKDYMLTAFDVHAYNYIVKGETSHDKTMDIITNVMKKANNKQKEYVLFTGIGEYRNIPLSSIKYFEVNKKIVTVHYEDKTFEFVSTIGKIENRLFTKGFVRVHRSFIVSQAAVRSFSYEEVVLSDGTKIPVGRKYYVSLKEAMGKSA